jgi:hypothetical protein
MQAHLCEPRRRPAFSAALSSCLLLAGTALGFLAARRGPASSGLYDDLAALSGWVKC